MVKRKVGRKIEKKKERHERIITTLRKKNDQTWTELIKSTNLSTESLTFGLSELIEQKLIKKNKKTKRYHLRVETKNKTLSVARDFNIMSLDLDESMKELRENERELTEKEERLNALNKILGEDE